MPLLTGDTLRTRLKQQRQLAIPAALRIAGQVAAALGHAHRHGVIHRDIKPEKPGKGLGKVDIKVRFTAES